MSLPRETSVAKSLDFSRLIRISPQTSNLLNSDGDTSSSSQQQHETLSNSFDDASLRPISQYHSLTQANPLSSVGEGRAFSDSLHRGTWETFLVFGMICVAIIASMASVVWFVRSYRDADVSDSKRIRRNAGDAESLDGSSGYSYDDSTYSSSNQSSLDTRSDFEVELDFEFSEDVNRPESNNGSTGAAGAIPTSTKVVQIQQQAAKVHSYA